MYNYTCIYIYIYLISVLNCYSYCTDNLITGFQHNFVIITFFLSDCLGKGKLVIVATKLLADCKLFRLSSYQQNRTPGLKFKFALQ